MTTDAINRRLADRYCPVMLGLLLLAGVAHAGERDSARPNVLLFLTDDQRASTIGVLGNPQIHTPNLDELATRPSPRDPQAIKRQIADYYAAVTFVDRQFGRLIEALEKSGQLANSIIVFAGDSGLAVGQHGLLGKQSLYDDAGVHIPLIMAGPQIPQSQRRGALVVSCDIFPTLCDLAGIETPSYKLLQPRLRLSIRKTEA